MAMCTVSVVTPQVSTVLVFRGLTCIDVPRSSLVGVFLNPQALHGISLWIEVINYNQKHSHAKNQSGTSAVFYHQWNKLIFTARVFFFSPFFFFGFKENSCLSTTGLSDWSVFNMTGERHWMRTSGLFVVTSISSLRRSCTPVSGWNEENIFPFLSSQKCCGLFCYDRADNHIQMCSIWPPLYKRWPLLSGLVNTLGGGSGWRW